MKIKPPRFSYLVSRHASTIIEDENDFIEMMDVHRKKSIGEGSLLIFRQDNENMMEEDVPQSCSSPIYENRIREVVDNDYAKSSQLRVTKEVDDVIVPYHVAETVVAEASFLPATKFGEVGVSIVGGEMLETQFLELSRVLDTYGVSIVGGEILETQFFEASRVPDSYGGETLQNQFVEASLVPGTCGAGVDVLSSQHVWECQKSCLPRPDQVRSASTLISPDIPTDRVVVNGLGSECAPGKEPSESEGKGHVSVGLGESCLTPGGFTSLIQQLLHKDIGLLAGDDGPSDYESSDSDDPS
ncbi:hypothetical protein IFM89_012727, partial [Coptis chinensis]